MSNISMNTLDEQLSLYPNKRDKIEKAAQLLGKEVEIVIHSDKEGDHLPLGTIGVVRGFDPEVFDGLILDMGEKGWDLVYPCELKVV